MALEKDGRGGETGAKQPPYGASGNPGVIDAMDREPLRGIPTPTEDTLSIKRGQPNTETVSDFPQHGCECDAQPVVDAGDVSVGNWVGDCNDIKFVAGEAHPGDREKIFTRGGMNRVPYPGMSGRDWNSTDAPAPNKMEK